MNDVKVGVVSIEHANNYGPDGRDPIKWTVTILGAGEATYFEHEQLQVALEAWRKVNPR